MGSPKILYVLFTYNRSNILNECVRTLLDNQQIKPDRWLIIDDGSETQLKHNIYGFHIENRGKLDIDYFSFSQNEGLGYQWQLALDYIRARDFDYIAWLEQDYIFRKNGIDEILEILKLKPLTIAASLYSNPDYYNGKQNTLFPQVMLDEFGVDLARREFLHKPLDLDTNLGKIKIQFTTNSCGCSMWNWNRMKELMAKYPEVWDRCFMRACNVPYPERRKYAGDGPLTSGTSHYWYKDIEDRIKNGLKIDYNTEGPWLDICDYSVGNHINGGPSLNGNIIPEMSSFVSSPKWIWKTKEEYDNFKRV